MKRLLRVISATAMTTAMTAAALVIGPPARAETLVVLSAAAAKQALADTSELLHRSTGNSIAFSFGTAGEMSKKALSGGPFDVVILPPAALAALATKGVLAPGSREDLGVVRLAAAVRSGSAPPDISTVPTLTAALTNAASIGMADPAAGATSGIYLAKLIQKLGLTETVKSKLRLFPDGQAAMEAVARGEVALGLGQKSEIMPVHGVRLIGDLPDSVQLNTIYSAALAAHSAGEPAARALFALLVDPTTRASFQANGFDLPK